MKKKTGRKLLGILLALALIVGLLPGISPMARAVDEEYLLWVGNTQVTSENKDDILGDGKAKYDPETYTLTLNGAKITSMYNFTGNAYAGIFYNGHGTLTIKGTGEVTVTTPQGQNQNYNNYNGICTSDSNLDFDGTFTITAPYYGISTSGGSLKVSGGNVTVEARAGISAGGEFNITGGVVTCVGGISGSSLSITGGALDVKDETRAIYMTTGISITAPEQVVTPSGGKAEAITTNVGSTPSTYHTVYTKEGEVETPATHVIIRADYPLWVGATQVTSANMDDILGDGGKATYDPTSNTLTLNDPTIQNLYNGGNFTAAISSTLNDLVIRGSATLSNPGGIDKVGISAVNLELNGDFSIEAGYHGISARNLKITDGNITVKGASPVSTGGTITINGGILTADAEGNGYAISGSGITIADGLTIVEPQGGTVRTAWIVNADGTRAQHVVIMKTWPLWVGGTQVTAKNYTDVFKDDKVSYNPYNNTLTLNNYDNDGANKAAPNAAAIEYTGTDPITIACKGSNALSVTGGFSNGIYTYGNEKLTVNLIDKASLTISADAGNETGATGIAATTTNGTSVTGKGTLTVRGTTQAIEGDSLSVADGLTVFTSSSYDGTDATKEENVNNVTTRKFVQITSSTEKPVAVVTTRPTANTLTANGAALPLVAAGEAIGGEMQYAIGTDSETAPTDGWSASIPTGTNAGTYYVWYKAVGDENHSDSEAACVTVTMAPRPTGGKVTPVKARPFEDVSEEDWFYEAVYHCYDNDYLKGVDDTHFDPQGTMTRAMFATVLYRIAGEPETAGENPFTDVEADTWYTDAVIWAAGEGIICGYGNGLFGTEDPVTREQMVTIFWRYNGSPTAENADLSKFTDADKISGWAQQAMEWAVSVGVISGKGNGILDPVGTATRAEVAQIVMNYDSKVK